MQINSAIMIHYLTNINQQLLGTESGHSHLPDIPYQTQNGLQSSHYAFNQQILHKLQCFLIQGI